MIWKMHFLSTKHKLFLVFFVVLLHEKSFFRTTFAVTITLLIAYSHSFSAIQNETTAVITYIYGVLVYLLRQDISSV